MLINCNRNEQILFKNNKIKYTCMNWLKVSLNSNPDNILSFCPYVQRSLNGLKCMVSQCVVPKWILTLFCGCDTQIVPSTDLSVKGVSCDDCTIVINTKQFASGNGIPAAKNAFLNFIFSMYNTDA